jgi:hypothetical protein
MAATQPRARRRGRRQRRCTSLRAANTRRRSVRCAAAVERLTHVGSRSPMRCHGRLQRGSGGPQACSQGTGRWTGALGAVGALL